MSMRWIFFSLIGIVFVVLLFKGCTRKIAVPSGSIVFLGDSITAGYGLSPEQAYPALINIPGMIAVNLGVSGSKTADGLQRLKDYFAGGATPQLVVIALGANDILQGTPPSAIEENLHDVIAECQSRHIPVLLSGINIPGKFGTDGIFVNVARQGRVPLLPDLMQGEAYQENLLQEDHMHPTAEGQKIIAEKMQTALLCSFSFGATGHK